MNFADSSIYVSKKKCVPSTLFMLIVLAGVIVGTVIMCVSDNLDGFHRLLFTHNIYKTDSGSSVYKLFLGDFLPLAFLIAIQFFSGYFAFGQLFAYATAIYRGAVTGISAVFTYMELGGQGFFAILVSIIPFAFTTAVAIVLGARETVRQCRQIAEFSFFGSSEAAPPDMKLYMIRYAVLLTAVVLLSLADGLATYFLWNRIFYC